MSQDIVFVKSDRAAQPEKKGDQWVVSAWEDIKVLKGDFTVVDTGIEKRGDVDVEWEWEVVHPWQTKLRAMSPFTPITHTRNECIALINTSESDVHVPKWSQYIKWGLKTTTPPTTPPTDVDTNAVDNSAVEGHSPTIVEDPPAPAANDLLDVVVNPVEEEMHLMPIEIPVNDTVVGPAPPAPVVDTVVGPAPPAPVVDIVVEAAPPAPVADIVVEAAPPASTPAPVADNVVDPKPKRKYIRKTKKDEQAPSSSA
jgi:hypothetical protein